MHETGLSAVKGAVWSAILLLALLGVQPGSAQAADKPLTNADVINLVRVGLGDDIVVAKIKEAGAVAFQLDTDNLLHLKGAGVNARVIATMLDRSATAKKEAAAVAPVRLLTIRGELSLNSIAGSLGTTWAYVTVLTFADYPGKTSTVRTTDRAPRFEITSKTNPTGRFYVVKAESNKNGTRSVKLGSGGPFKSSHGAPDSDWTVPYNVTEKSAGVWLVSLSQQLEPGEYGIWSQGKFDLQAGFTEITMTGVLYDFGVD